MKNFTTCCLERSLKLVKMFAFMMLLAACSHGQGELEGFIMPDELEEHGEAKYELRLVYFIAADREPVKDYEKKIEVWCAFINDFFVRSLNARNIKVKGPVFRHENGKLKIEIVRGKHPAAYYGGSGREDAKDPWTTIDVEVDEALGSRWKNCYLIFAETYGEGPAPYEFPGTIAYGARWGNHGGIGVVSAWFLRDEFSATSIAGQMKLMHDATPIQGRNALGDGGRKNSPRYQFIEDIYGAILHELGHVFGLPHDHRDGDVYMMGNGFRRMREFYLIDQADRKPVGFSFENARVLAFNRFLHGERDLTDTQDPKVTIKLPEQVSTHAQSIPLELIVTDEKSLGAMVIHVSDGDTVVYGRGFKAGEKVFNTTIALPRTHRQLKQVSVHVIVIDHGGNFVRKDGVVHLKQ